MDIEKRIKITSRWNGTEEIISWNKFIRQDVKSVAKNVEAKVEKVIQLLKTGNTIITIGSLYRLV